MSRQSWTEAEKRFIRENASRLKDHELAARLSQILGRPISMASVRQERQRMGIKKKHGRGVCEVASTRPSPLDGMGLGLSILGEQPEGDEVA